MPPIANMIAYTGKLLSGEDYARLSGEDYARLFNITSKVYDGIPHAPESGIDAYAGTLGYLFEGQVAIVAHGQNLTPVSYTHLTLPTKLEV